MSSLAKKIAKNIEESQLQFPVDMYNNIVGSLVITNWILTKDKPPVAKIKTSWKKLKREGLKFWIDDKEFIPKVLKKFNLEPHYGKFAMCQSSSNVLFAPYENNMVYPIREDGLYAPTIKHGKIYPIMESENVLEEKSGSSEENK